MEIPLLPVSAIQESHPPVQRMSRFRSLPIHHYPKMQRTHRRYSDQRANDAANQHKPFTTPATPQPTETTLSPAAPTVKTLDTRCTLKSGGRPRCKRPFITIHHFQHRFPLLA